jgi:hypothetical protein
MGTRIVGAALVALGISIQELAAQEPESPGRRKGEEMQQHMRMMDSANARLDTLVRRMNRATGNAKVAAMAEVINEMVSQRRAMQAHMRQMMQGHDRGGGMMKQQRPGSDTSAHGQHHPESGSER